MLRTQTRRVQSSLRRGRVLDRSPVGPEPAFAFLFTTGLFAGSTIQPFNRGSHTLPYSPGLAWELGSITLTSLRSYTRLPCALGLSRCSEFLVSDCGEGEVNVLPIRIVLTFLGTFFVLALPRDGTFRFDVIESFAIGILGIGSKHRNSESKNKPSTHERSLTSLPAPLAPEPYVRNSISPDKGVFDSQHSLPNMVQPCYEATEAKLTDRARSLIVRATHPGIPSLGLATSFSFHSRDGSPPSYSSLTLKLSHFVPSKQFAYRISYIHRKQRYLMIIRWTTTANNNYEERKKSTALTSTREIGARKRRITLFGEPDGTEKTSNHGKAAIPGWASSIPSLSGGHLRNLVHHVVRWPPHQGDRIRTYSPLYPKQMRRPVCATPRLKPRLPVKTREPREQGGENHPRLFIRTQGVAGKLSRKGASGSGKRDYPYPRHFPNPPQSLFSGSVGALNVGVFFLKGENGTEKQASYFLDGCPSYSETHELAGSVLSVPYDPSLKGGSVRSGPALTSNSFARTDSNRALKTWLKEPFPRVPYTRIKWSHPGLARYLSGRKIWCNKVVVDCVDRCTEFKHSVNYTHSKKGIRMKFTKVLALSDLEFYSFFSVLLSILSSGRLYHSIAVTVLSAEQKTYDLRKSDRRSVVGKRRVAERCASVVQEGELRSFTHLYPCPFLAFEHIETFYLSHAALPTFTNLLFGAFLLVIRKYLSKMLKEMAVRQKAKHPLAWIRRRRAKEQFKTEDKDLRQWESAIKELNNPIINYRAIFEEKAILDKYRHQIVLITREGEFYSRKTEDHFTLAISEKKSNSRITRRARSHTIRIHFHPSRRWSIPFDQNGGPYETVVSL
ncbi:basic-leucine zipper transcription factor family protein [Striga asiatica]|uniref:Basic-leucine zipper transcription factor family protein n=1 Tax=Striga asiatica TaxID=4170 RepID=A0A5A7QJY2_STRAF|nr:basic-leucine zipper transcription factor family protein [Striga asiatica]